MLNRFILAWHVVRGKPLIYGVKFDMEEDAMRRGVILNKYNNALVIEGCTFTSSDGGEVSREVHIG